MRLILNKRFFIPVLFLIFFGLIFILILASPRFPSAAPAYAYLVDDWDILTPTSPPPPPPGTVRLGGGLSFKFVNSSFHIVSLPDGNTIRRFYGVDKWVEDLIPSPNYQLGIFQGVDSAFPQSRKMIQLWDGGVRTFTFDQQLREPNVWSPDSAYLTVGINNTCPCDRNNFIVDLGIVDVGSGELRQLTTGENILQDYRAVTWSPDGAALVYVTHAPDPVVDRADIVKLVFVSGGQPRTLFNQPNVGNIYVRWLPDGQHVALSSLGREAEIWFVDAQKLKSPFITQRLKVSRPAGRLKPITLSPFHKPILP